MPEKPKHIDKTNEADCLRKKTKHECRSELNGFFEDEGFKKPPYRNKAENSPSRLLEDEGGDGPDYDHRKKKYDNYDPTGNEDEY